MHKCEIHLEPSIQVKSYFPYPLSQLHYIETLITDP